MGHSNNDILDAIINAAINECFHARYKGLRAFESKTFIIRVFGCKEVFKTRAPYQAVQDPPSFVRRIFVRLWYLHPVADPVTLLSVWYVDVLNTIRTAIYSFAFSPNLSKRHFTPFSALESRKYTRT